MGEDRDAARRVLVIACGALGVVGAAGHRADRTHHLLVVDDHAERLAQEFLQWPIDLAAEVVRRFGLTTKRAAVDLALRRLVGLPLTREFLLGLEGIGWQGDLNDLRSERPD